MLVVFDDIQGALLLNAINLLNIVHFPKILVHFLDIGELLGRILAEVVLQHLELLDFLQFFMLFDIVQFVQVYHFLTDFSGTDLVVLRAEFGLQNLVLLIEGGQLMHVYFEFFKFLLQVFLLGPSTAFPLVYFAHFSPLLLASAGTLGVGEG